MERKGKAFIISGPSGVGKSTVLKALFEGRNDLYFSVSATTRDPRPGEVNGQHYHFISPEQFMQWINEDAFLEYAQYVGNFYGTPMRYVDEAMDAGKDVILDIEVQGALQVCTKRSTNNPYSLYSARQRRNGLCCPQYLKKLRYSCLASSELKSTVSSKAMIKRSQAYMIRSSFVSQFL